MTGADSESTGLEGDRAIGRARCGFRQRRGRNAEGWWWWWRDSLLDERDDWVDDHTVSDPICVTQSSIREVQRHNVSGNCRQGRHIDQLTVLEFVNGSRNRPRK